MHLLEEMESVEVLSKLGASALVLVRGFLRALLVAQSRLRVERRYLERAGQ